MEGKKHRVFKRRGVKRKRPEAFKGGGVEERGIGRSKEGGVDGKNEWGFRRSGEEAQGTRSPVEFRLAITVVSCNSFPQQSPPPPGKSMILHFSGNPLPSQGKIPISNSNYVPLFHNPLFIYNSMFL
jgi:hypothetical protein